MAALPTTPFLDPIHLYNNQNATADYQIVGASGDGCNASVAGYYSHATVKGDCSSASSAGDSSTSQSEGDSTKASAAGHGVTAVSHGYAGRAAAAGDESDAIATGDFSQAVAAGDNASAFADGDGGVAIVAGCEGHVRAGVGGCFAAAYFDPHSQRFRILTGITGEGGILPGVTYHVVFNFEGNPSWEAVK